MPSKKKKYNARFPAGRIKKIMQTDEEVGKVAQAVPIIISRTLELFVESLLTKSMQITQARNAKTLTPSHMKQCILSESRFDFLKDLVKNIPDASVQEDNENNAIFDATYSRVGDRDTGNENSQEGPSPSPEVQVLPPLPPPPPLFQAPNFYSEQTPSGSSSRTPVIQYVPKVAAPHVDRQNLHIKIASETLPMPQLLPMGKSSGADVPAKRTSVDNVPPLVPLSNHAYSQSTSGNLCIDEDYDN